MKKILSLFLMSGLWSLAFAPWTCCQAQTNAPSRLEYDSFRLITDRNIFDPRRSARSARSERARTRTVRGDSFALVGTMSYEKGLFAFFDGSNPDYRKVLKKEDTIAGFKVAQIEPSHVTLASPTNQVDLRVGMQLRHNEDGEWQVSDRTDSSTPASGGGTSRRSAQARGDRPTLAGTSESSSTNAADKEPAPEEEPASLTDSQEPPTTAEATPASTNGGNDVLERLKRKAAAERGESPQ